MKRSLFIVLTSFVIVLNGCSSEEEPVTLTPAEQLEADIEKIENYLSSNSISNFSKTNSGLHYVIAKEGSGDNPQSGQRVSVHYTGTFLNGTKFDSSIDRGQPIEFTLGIGQVITGWEEGIPLFKSGGKGTIYLPSALAYGTTGSGGAIGPNEVLIFDIELIEIN